MNTKEAIEWIFDVWHEWENVYGFDAEQNLKEGKKLDEVIELLKRGERLEKMWKELYEIASEFNFFPLMDKIKQEYFPKEEKE